MFSDSLNTTLPSVGFKCPERIFAKVVCPFPATPAIPSICPPCSLRFTLLKFGKSVLLQETSIRFKRLDFLVIFIF